MHTFTLQSILQESNKCADFGNHLMVDMPLEWPDHVYKSFFGIKHFSGGSSDLRLTPTSWGIWRNDLPW